MPPNHLEEETSPYLRQHADNPVEWYPWGPEALALAQEQDKPLFVSIGYASCHWCHVMAHESFEDPDTASDLARSFISVKVDREERPDLDAVYMSAVQAMTGSGGWPTSVFCTPDGRPFFGGTYFPPVDRGGMPGFRRLLGALAEAWTGRRDEVEQQADALAAAIHKDLRLADELAGRGDVDAGPLFGPVLTALVADLAERFDPTWGGFGGAPKFPRPILAELCLIERSRTGDAHAATMATTTLDAMAAGGIYDHLAGGFARYATDEQWMVPHFEKMLTDQALLARAYLHAYLVTKEPNYLQVTSETLSWVLDELSSPEGALFSSVDADADGVEGGHATFTPSQVDEALREAGREELSEAVCDFYGVHEPGNWEGTTVLHRPLRAPLERPPEIEEARRILLAARRTQPQPAVDDKVLTEWNAMAVATLAEAAWATGNVRWRDRAVQIADFLFARLRRDDGRFLRSYQGGRAQQLAFAADYAWVLEACTRLAELTGEARWLARAIEVADGLLELFSDGPDGSGLYTTGNDAESLVVRPSDLIDGAVPSANSVAATALLRLGALSGQDRYREAGEALVGLVSPLLSAHPMAVADLLSALLVATEGTEVLVAGEAPALLSEVRRRWLPGAVVAWGERTESPLWEGRADGSAYVCHHFVCATPTSDPGTLAAQLDERASV